MLIYSYHNLFFENVLLITRGRTYGRKLSNLHSTVVKLKTFRSVSVYTDKMNLALFSLLFSFFARLRKGEAFILQPQAPRNITMILRVANGAHWGRWGQPEFCASGTFAIGYSLKVYNT